MRDDYAITSIMGLLVMTDTEYGLQVSKKHTTNGAPSASEDTSHILGIVSSLFSNLASESPARVRLLAKFVENNYEKADKLLEIRDNAHGRLIAVDAEINKEQKVSWVEPYTVQP